MTALDGFFAEQGRLDALFNTRPKRGPAALDRFTDLYATSELPEFHAIVDTIIAWGDQILAWHDTGEPSNGRIEGTNNLLQVLRRVAHGFTNPDNFAARGLLLRSSTRQNQRTQIPRNRAGPRFSSANGRWHGRTWLAQCVRRAALPISDPLDSLSKNTDRAQTAVVDAGV